MALFDNSGIKLFGLNIQRAKPTEKEDPSASFAMPVENDGASILAAASSAAYYGVYFDVTGNLKDDIAYIQKYREIALFPEVDIAIQDIVNETIPHEDSTEMITLDLDDLDYSDALKDRIRAEFKRTISLLKYNEMGSDIFRRWYVDGRLYYHIIVDKANLKRGILELRLIEATKIRKFKEVKKKKTESGVDAIDEVTEYYVYNESGFVPSSPNTTVSQNSANSSGNSAQLQGIKLSPDSVIYVPSGYIDGNSNSVLSYLHKAIRPANQLRMLEDATVIYIIARAPERRIFYVDVGTLPKLKAEQVVKELMNKYRNKMVYDAKSGEVRDDKKYMCLAMDTKVPLLDGRVLTISEISEEYNSGKKLWAYSCDPQTGAFSPGLITWAGATRKNADVVKVTLDNGKTIVCTPDHKFPVWNKGFVEAKDLVIGESMVPHYTKQEKLTKNTYSQLFQNDTKSWEYVHRLVSRWKTENKCDAEFTYDSKYLNEAKTTTHHIDYNRYNNSPENLVRMHSKDHYIYHKKDVAKMRESFQEYMQDPEFKERFVQAHKEAWTEDHRSKQRARATNTNLSGMGNEALKSLWGNSEYKESRSSRYRTQYYDGMFSVLKDCVFPKCTMMDVLDRMNTNTDFDKWKNVNSGNIGTQKDWNKVGGEDIYRMVRHLGFRTFNEYKSANEFGNHKITNIEFLDEKIDTGCLTIDGEEQYHSNHTFALDAGIYTKNSMLEDFWMPRRDNGKGTEITTLPGASNLQGQIDTLDYFKKKLYDSLNVPQSRMQQQEGGFNIGQSGNISRDEIKFQKFIEKLRRKFSQLLLYTLRTQLILTGICNSEEWDSKIKENLRLIFQRDNFYDELKNQELLGQRMMMLPQVDQYLQKYFSKKWVQKNVLNMTDKEVEVMTKEIQEEAGDPSAQPTIIGGMMPPGAMGEQPGEGGQTQGGPEQQPQDQPQQ